MLSAIRVRLVQMASRYSGPSRATKEYISVRLRTLMEARQETTSRADIRTMEQAVTVLFLVAGLSRIRIRESVAVSRLGTIPRCLNIYIYLPTSVPRLGTK